MGKKARIVITSAGDLADSRAQGIALAKHLAFKGAPMTTVASVLSELARFIIDHSLRGEILVERIDERDFHGVQFILKLRAPPVGARKKARRSGSPSGCTLPHGITRFKSVMDEFHILSESKVVMKKWFR